jgi:hypothetical protein
VSTQDRPKRPVDRTASCRFSLCLALSVFAASVNAQATREVDARWLAEDRARKAAVARLQRLQNAVYAETRNAVEHWSQAQRFVVEPEIRRMLSVATYTLLEANCAEQVAKSGRLDPTPCFAFEKDGSIGTAVSAYLERSKTSGERPSYPAILAGIMRRPADQWAQTERPLVRCFDLAKTLQESLGVRGACTAQSLVRASSLPGVGPSAIFENPMAAYQAARPVEVSDLLRSPAHARVPPFDRLCKMRLDEFPSTSVQLTDSVVTTDEIIGDARQMLTAWYMQPVVVDIDVQGDPGDSSLEALDELADTLAVWVSIGPRGIWALRTRLPDGSMRFWIREDVAFVHLGRPASLPSQINDLPYWAPVDRWRHVMPLTAELLSFVTMESLPGALKQRLSESAHQAVLLTFAKGACGNRSGVLGCASPQSGLAIAGVLRRSPDGSLDVTVDGAAAPLVHVFLHELGHWLGLPHVAWVAEALDAAIMEPNVRSRDHCVTNSDQTLLSAATNVNWQKRLKDCEGLRVQVPAAPTHPRAPTRPVRPSD